MAIKRKAPVRETEAPEGNWYDLGIVLPPGASDRIRLSCPQCAPSRHKQDTSLAVNVDKGIWYCFYCGWKGSLRGYQRVEKPLPSVLQPPIPDVSKQEAIQRVWQASRHIRSGDPVHRYLQRRGLMLPLEALPAVLRYHPRLCYQYNDGRRTYHPAMVALVQAPDGTMVNVHRTYLTADGHKANVPTVKKLMPPAVPGATRGGAIRLSPAGETLAVAEGLETALAVRLATDLPVWATIAASNMALLVVPDVVRLVVICADHDKAGLDAAKSLARRLLAEERRAKILTPEKPGTDWLDTLEGCHV